MPNRSFILSLALLTPLLLLLTLDAGPSVAHTGGSFSPALTGALTRFDEVAPISNSFVITGDGALHPADDLALLAQDAGEQAPASQWGWVR